MRKAPRTEALIYKHAQEYDSGKAVLGHQYSDLADLSRNIEDDLENAIEILKGMVSGIPDTPYLTPLYLRAREAVRKASAKVT